MGDVGRVLRTEAARLSRTDKDWCHLLEICTVCGTLIGDAEPIYDVNVTEDQLILGINGTLSVMELRVMKSRLFQGQEHKAMRGELQARGPRLPLSRWQVTRQRPQSARPAGDGAGVYDISRTMECAAGV